MFIRSIPKYTNVSCFGVKMKMAAHSGNTANSIYIEKLDRASIIDRSINPELREAKMSVISANLTYFGAAWSLEHRFLITSPAGKGFERSEIAEECHVSAGISAVETKEDFAVKVVSSTTNVYTCTKGAGTGAIKNLNYLDIREALGMMKNDGAKELTGMLTASPDYGTTPIEQCYVLFVDPYSAGVLAEDAATAARFTPVSLYSGMGKTHTSIPGEIGTIQGKIRIVESQFMVDTITVGSQQCRKGILMGAEAFFKMDFASGSPLEPTFYFKTPTDLGEVVPTTYAFGYSMYDGIVLNRDLNAKAILYAAE